MMPAVTEIQRRDRALVAFTILTCARDGAIASLKLKHVDIDQSRVEQDARQVRTKFSKSFTTWFFPVGSDVEQIVHDRASLLSKLHPNPAEAQWRWRGQRSEPLGKVPRPCVSEGSPVQNDVGHSPDNFESHDPP
jgi:hypothetical protein